MSRDRTGTMRYFSERNSPPVRYGIAVASTTLAVPRDVQECARIGASVDLAIDREYCDGVHYAIPRFSRNEIDEAGVALLEPPVWRPDYLHALEVVNNWRASHARPLNTFQMTLKNYATLIRHLANRLEVVPRLEAFGNAINAHLAPNAYGPLHYYVMELDTNQPASPLVSIYGFRKGELRLAEQHEQELAESGKDVVMVSVDSIDALHKAYPNYFLDTKLFLRAVQNAVLFG